MTALAQQAMMSFSCVMLIWPRMKFVRVVRLRSTQEVCALNDGSQIGCRIDTIRYFYNCRIMKQKDALAALAALSQDTRLSVFRYLVTVGEEGAAAGDIAQTLKIASPTLSFHLKELEQARLVGSHRESRSIIYVANYESMRALLAFLMEDCCRGRPEICGMPVKRKECAS